MRDKNIKDPECQKQLVQTFVNAVFVYDDKVTITFNYSGDKRTVTLAEVDSLGTEGAEFVCRALCSTTTSRQAFWFAAFLCQKYGFTLSAAAPSSRKIYWILREPC